MKIRTRLGVSLDGFATFANGLPAWDAMPTFGPGSHGSAEFTEQCAAVVIGRTTFDQGYEHWLPNWPYAGKQVFVLTSRPLPEYPAELKVSAVHGGPEALVERLRGANLDGDVNLLGGPRTVQSLLEVGALDELGFCLLPVLLGTGIPFFDIQPTSFSQAAWDALLASPSEPAPRARLQLERHRVFPDGAIELVYRKASE